MLVHNLCSPEGRVRESHVRVLIQLARRPLLPAQPQLSSWWSVRASLVVSDVISGRMMFTGKAASPEQCSMQRKQGEE